MGKGIVVYSEKGLGKRGGGGGVCSIFPLDTFQVVTPTPPQKKHDMPSILIKEHLTNGNNVQSFNSARIETKD